MKMQNEIFEVNETILIKPWENSTTITFAKRAVVLKECISSWVADRLDGNPIWRQGWIVELPDGKHAGVRFIKERKE